MPNPRVGIHQWRSMAMAERDEDLRVRVAEATASLQQSRRPRLRKVKPVKVRHYIFLT